MLNISFLIAKKYFSLKNIRTFTSLVSMISILSIATITVIITVVLSIFNGLQGLVTDLFKAYNPDVRIEVADKNFFELNEVNDKIKSISGVKCYVGFVEDQVMLSYKNYNVVAKLKGVTDNFLDVEHLDNFITQGSFALKGDDNNNKAIIGAGIQSALNIDHLDDFYSLKVFYPKSAVGMHTSSLYRKKNINIGGIISIEKNFDDNYVLVPIDFASALMNTGNKVSGIDVYVNDKASIAYVKQCLARVLPNTFTVLDCNELNVSLFNAMKVERLLLFIVSMFILSIASFNIFFITGMFIIKKRNDIKLLFMLGAKSSSVKYIFVLNSLFIALLGVLIGSIISFIFCLLEYRYGFLSLLPSTLTVYKYPLSMHWQDYLFTGSFIIFISLLSSYLAANKATK